MDAINAENKTRDLRTWRWRGMLSDENLETILDEELGFIVAHPLRRSHIAAEVIAELGEKFDRRREEEQFLSDERTSLRFVLAYSPQISREVREERQARLSRADAFVGDCLRKLANPSGRDRKATPQGTYDRVRDYLRDHHLLSFYDIDLVDVEVVVRADRKARAWEEKIDGMLLLETTDLTLPPEEIVRRYKELAEIERGFRALKSSLMLRPFYHWTEDRIRAHVVIGEGRPGRKQEECRKKEDQKYEGRQYPRRNGFPPRIVPPRYWERSKPDRYSVAQSSRSEFPSE